MQQAVDAGNDAGRVVLTVHRPLLVADPSASPSRVAAVSVRDANVAAVVLSLGARPETIRYDKATRYDERSRVGLVGLAREALGSLFLSSRWERRRVLHRAPESDAATDHPVRGPKA